MFGKNGQEKEKATVVTTKEQLKAAVNKKEAFIEVRGDLAKKMNWMAKLSKKKAATIIAVLTGAAIAAPATGGTSLAAAGAVSAEVMVIVTLLGGITVIAILKDYNIEADAVNGVLRLTKNK